MTFEIAKGQVSAGRLDQYLAEQIPFLSRSASPRGYRKRERAGRELGSLSDEGDLHSLSDSGSNFPLTLSFHFPLCSLSSPCQRSSRARHHILSRTGQNFVFVCMPAAVLLNRLLLLTLAPPFIPLPHFALALLFHPLVPTR